MPIHRLVSSLAATIGIAAPRKKPPRARLFAICAVIFLTAFCVRLLYWQDNYADLLRGKNDSGLQKVSFFYYDQAQRILDDGGILFPRGPVDPGDATVLTHPPGYSILMAAVFGMFYRQDSQQELLAWPQQGKISSPGSRKSEADSALRIIQIVGDSASSVVVFLIAAELFPVGLAFIAAMLCGFSPHFAYYSLMLGPDSLSILPVLLASFFLVRSIKRPRLTTIVTAGTFVGLSCWLRSNALLLGPLLACIIPLLFERGKRLRYSFALIAATAVVIAPIMARNWIVFHQFVPLSIMAGLNLVEGIGDYDEENRFGMPSSDAEAASKDAEWHGRPDYAESLWRPEGIERDEVRFKRGLAVVRSNPGWFLGVILRRVEFMLRYNDSREDLYLIAAAPVLSAVSNFSHSLEPPVQMAPMWSSSTLIIIGIILLALARRGRVLAVLLIVPLYYLIAQSPLHTEYRYVLAIHYFLFVIAAATIYYGSLVLGQSLQRGFQLALGKLK